MAKATGSRTGKLNTQGTTIVYLTEGTKGIENAYTAGKVSADTIRKSMKHLAAIGRNIEPLATWIVSSLGSGGRGRSTPVKGEKRMYSAQQVKSGGPFIRLPLESIGISKKQKVEVYFEGSRIVISPVNAAATAPTEQAQAA